MGFKSLILNYQFGTSHFMKFGQPFCLPVEIIKTPVKPECRPAKFI
jgi:hypothetical protein